MLGEIVHSESAQTPGPPRRASSAALGRPLTSREAGGAPAALGSKRGGRDGWRDGGGGRRAGGWELTGSGLWEGGSGRVLSDARSRLSVCPQAVSGPGRASFPFPYTPYRIQEQFMAALYAALEAGRIGIFESPTGTVSCGEGGSDAVTGLLAARFPEWCSGRGSRAGRAHSLHKNRVWGPVTRCVSHVCAASFGTVRRKQKGATCRVIKCGIGISVHGLGLVPHSWNHRQVPLLCGGAGASSDTMCGLSSLFPIPGKVTEPHLRGPLLAPRL